MTAGSLGLRVSKSSKDITGGLPRDFREHVAGLHLVAILDHQVRARGHEVLLANLARRIADKNRGLMFLIARRNVTTSWERPVTSSTCSSIVSPGRSSSTFTCPAVSVRIENVNGSHSARTWPWVTLSPSVTRRRAP